MAMTVSLVFSLHSLLFAGYLAYLLHLVVCRLGPGDAIAFGADALLEGWDERVVTATAHTTLMLYLVYAEVYLYHTCQLARP